MLAKIKNKRIDKLVLKTGSRLKKLTLEHLHSNSHGCIRLNQAVRCGLHNFAEGASPQGFPCRKEDNPVSWWDQRTICVILTMELRTCV